MFVTVDADVSTGAWRRSTDSLTSPFPKFPANPGCAPQRVRCGHLTNQRADIVRHCWAAGAMSALPRPEQAKALSVPREDGFRLDDVDGRAPAAPYARASHAHSDRRP